MSGSKILDFCLVFITIKSVNIWMCWCGSSKFQFIKRNLTCTVPFIEAVSCFCCCVVLCFIFIFYPNPCMCSTVSFLTFFASSLQKKNSIILVATSATASVIMSHWADWKLSERTKPETHFNSLGVLHKVEYAVTSLWNQAVFHFTRNGLIHPKIMYR